MLARQGKGGRKPSSAPYLRRSNPARSEREIITRIHRLFRSNAGGGSPIRVGPGDDAAILRAGNSDLVVSTDWFLEGSHFLAGVHPPDAVGYKALARAASDLAAMGALPACFFLSLALPASRTGNWLAGFLSGLRRASRRMGLPLAGGDTAACQAVAIAITVIGETAGVRPVLRSGAKPGDLVYVSGILGAAQLGLEIVQRRMHKARALRPLLARHLYPQPRLELGQWLARNQLATAMIDTSDGLSTDLENLCRASGVGAVIRAERLPAVRIPRTLPASLRKRLSIETLALHGGEDYELLFTVPRRLARKIPSSYRGVRLTCVGEVTRSRQVVVESNGKRSVLEPRGWDHFRRA